ncbi:hypothetical protein KAR91_65075 [Candidatus Pacearchaeota archaeon]|nr:hypothetical protein [Candidatus Pacearchaeota archaeon]
MSYIIDRLKEVFETTVESGIKYEGSIENPDYYGLVCKAAAKDQLYKLLGNNLCMFNCEVNNIDAIMMLFSIPINTSEESGAKHVAERVMEVVENIEKCFVTLDDVRSEQIQEDKFVYVTAIKKIGKN